MPEIAGQPIATPNELAKQWGVSPNTIRDWCNDPKSDFPRIRIGTHFKIPVKAALDWINSKAEKREELMP